MVHFSVHSHTYDIRQRVLSRGGAKTSSKCHQVLPFESIKWWRILTRVAVRLCPFGIFLDLKMRLLYAMHCHMYKCMRYSDREDDSGALRRLYWPESKKTQINVFQRTCFIIKRDLSGHTRPVSLNWISYKCISFWKSTTSKGEQGNSRVQGQLKRSNSRHLLSLNKRLIE